VQPSVSERGTAHGRSIGVRLIVIDPRIWDATEDFMYISLTHSTASASEYSTFPRTQGHGPTVVINPVFHHGFLLTDPMTRTV
jgi:hypothetical protein